MAMQSGAVEDGVCNLFGCKSVCAKGHVGRAVEWQAALVARSEVGVIGENGTHIFGPAAAGESGVELDFEVHEQGAGGVEEKGTRVFAFDGATAESQHKGVNCREPRDGCMLAVAKGVFAVARKDVGDGRACFGLNHIVHVNKLPAEARGEDGADGGLAGAHEAGENDATRRRRRDGLICGGQMDSSGFGECVATPV